MKIDRKLLKEKLSEDKKLLIKEKEEVENTILDYSKATSKLREALEYDDLCKKIDSIIIVHLNMASTGVMNEKRQLARVNNRLEVCTRVQKTLDSDISDMELIDILGNEFDNFK